MRYLKCIFIFTTLAINACGQSPSRHTIHPEAVKLNNKIIELSPYLDNPDSCRKAIAYLDQATTIDSNYFLGYYNKLIFLYPLKQYEKAVFAVNNCIRLKPGAHDLYLTGGVLYEKIGNKILAKRYFEKSLAIVSSVLDTMEVNSLNYEMLSINKGINLIMLGQDKRGRDIIKAMYERQKEPHMQEMALLFLNKGKEELIETMISEQYGR